MSAALLALGYAVTTLGAALRLTRLATLDTITEPIRVAVINTAPNRLRPWVLEWITCWWCIGTWISIATTATAAAAWHYGAHPWFLAPAAALTVAYLVGLAGRYLD